MRRVVLDSNAVDPLIDLPGAYEAVQAAVDGGRLEVLYTHVTIEELAATRDPDRRSSLLLAVSALGALVPTGAFALDVSRLGLARLSDAVEAMERRGPTTSPIPGMRSSRSRRHMRSVRWSPMKFAACRPAHAIKASR
jgi:hypothetical protein